MCSPSACGTGSAGRTRRRRCRRVVMALSLPASADPARPGADPVIETPMVEIEGVNFWYGAKQALKDVSMAVPKQRITAYIGPSGCGKSTLLRCLNRMNDLIDGVRITGSIRIGGTDIYDP